MQTLEEGLRLWLRRRQNALQSVQPVANETAFAPAVGFALGRAVPPGAGALAAYQACPHKRQSDQSHEPPDAQMRLFEVEAAGLQGREHRFDGPPLRVAPARPAGLDVPGREQKEPVIGAPPPDAAGDDGYRHLATVPVEEVSLAIEHALGALREGASVHASRQGRAAGRITNPAVRAKTHHERDLALLEGL